MAAMAGGSTQPVVVRMTVEGDDNRGGSSGGVACDRWWSWFGYLAGDQGAEKGFGHGVNSKCSIDVSWLEGGVTRIGVQTFVLMDMTIRTRWIRRGALIRRMTERRVRRLATTRTVVIGRRRIFAPVPLMVVPPTVVEGRELPMQEVSTTRHDSGSSNGWLEESDDEEHVGDNFELIEE
ncbi:hypothetical protein L1987_38227 [Smallanthus sonchifolius]|uniref:Uncharacterized protein n=1 Tax=Smallanthus sonchifolius TaxID=185202 RepID=A0ACB9HIX8_9ASTR|nr:hypothetical protein L1987_38227 [Smallanthus sonchifolius]